MSPGTEIETVARTVKTPEITGFWIKKGVTTTDEEFASLQNVIAEVNTLLKIEKTDKQ